MSDDQTEKLREHFMLFDKDKNGLIDSNELGLALRSLGFHIEEKDLKGIIEEFDKNKNGKIEFDEFANLVGVRMKTPLTEEELKEAFALFDKDNNGKISSSELKKALTQFGEMLTDQEADEFLEDIDTNGNGELTIEELSRFLLAQRY